jgi:quinol monooxygenase YgiN
VTVLAVGRLYGHPERRDALRALMRETERAVAGAPGCLAYGFSVSVADPDVYVVVQEWADQASYDAHYAAPAYAEWVAAVGPLLARTSELAVHQVAATARPVPSAPMDPRLAD